MESAGDVESLKAALKTKPKAGAIVISGPTAAALDGFYTFLQDYNREIAAKVVFLLPPGLSPDERRTFRRSGRIMLGRPLPLEDLEGLLKVVMGA